MKTERKNIATTILAAMTSRLADATAAGLPCGVPTHSVGGTAEEMGIDPMTAFGELTHLVDGGHVERLPGRDALGFASYRLVARATS